MKLLSPFRSWVARVPAVLFLVAAAVPAPLLACATCFGKSDSQMAKGMNAGIFTLLICILSVLAAIVVFFVYILRRAARMAAQARAVAPLPSPTHS
ncbi:MAG: hypothetical protein RJA22_1317 [Verrucomicrobiota bacterium]|jgi:RsiW-degrading membrane proteinase PrsW (M82 family)